MTHSETKAGHKRPSYLEREAAGRYRVKGTQLVIVQDGKVWRVEGHDGDLGSFANRHAATEVLEARGLVPQQPAEAKPVEEMTGKELTEVKPELHPDAEAKPADPTPTKVTRSRPRTAKQAAAKAKPVGGKAATATA
jgi:hypothetical protein